MTSLMKHPNDAIAPWNIMPGWGVVADLTPPELTEMRRLRSLRKVIALGLIAVVIVCVAGFAYAMFRESSKQDALDTARDEGTQLTVRSGKYATVVRVKSATDSIDAQISTVMANQVDTAALLSRFRTILPGSMSLTSVNVSLTGGSTTSAADAATPGSDGDPVIGTVTLSGSSNRLADLAGYVTALQAQKGITNVLPASNSSGAAGNAAWSVTLSITNKLLTHKYDHSTSSGGN